MDQSKNRLSYLFVQKPQKLYSDGIIVVTNKSVDGHNQKFSKITLKY